ncbi:MAG: hypothetical protein OEU50_02875 [Gammaproteobacteria bacterium]|nr:hypothetical protein [Gammaproteobacteria bacterium]
MSVINNVLKDLETRESRFTPIEIASVSAQSQTRRDLKPAALATLLLLVPAAGGWFYLQQQPMPLVAAPVSLVASDSIASLPVEMEADPLSAAIEAPLAADDIGAGIVTEQVIGNQIIGLQIRESEQDMQLEFVLREKVVAYLKERRENSFGYHLRDIESQIVAPEVSDNPWINGLAISATAQGVDIQFDTAPEILVETRQGEIDGESVWAISLRKSIAPPAPAVAATETTPAKTPEVAEPLSGRPAPFQVPESVAVAESASTAIAPAAALVKLEIKSTDPNAKSTNQLEYAVELINSRRYADAENLLLGLLTGVEDHNARLHLLALYQDQKHAERFSRLARESMDRYPQESLFRTEYGRSLFQGADYSAVIRLFSADTRPDPVEQALLGASYQRLDQHANAIRHYRLALELDANSARNWVGLGISLEHSAKLEDALASYRRAASLGKLSNTLQAFVDKRRVTLERVLN